jgi:hypothetical protein
MKRVSMGYEHIPMPWELRILGVEHAKKLLQDGNAIIKHAIETHKIENEKGEFVKITM